MYSPGLNFSREPPPIRSTYQSTPPPWHSHNSFFSGEPSSNRNFFPHLNKLLFWEGPSPAKKLHIFTKANCPLDWKKKRKTKQRHKNIVLCRQPPASPPPPPPPPAYFPSGTISAVVFWCARVCVCVRVCKYLLWNHWANCRQNSYGTSMG